MTEPTAPAPTDQERITSLEEKLRVSEEEKTTLLQKIDELNGEEIYAGLERIRRARDEAAAESGRLLTRFQEKENEGLQIKNQAKVDQAIASRMVVERNGRNKRITTLEAIRAAVSEKLAQLAPDKIAAISRAQVAVIIADAKDKLDEKKPI